MKVREVSSVLEAWAPPSYQESYDNSGLLVGDEQAQVKGILTTLDVTEQVLEEALQKKCNLIVAHHPILFKSLKHLVGRTYVERTLLKALKYKLNIYALHTNLDHVFWGTNQSLAKKIGLQSLQILKPKHNLLSHLSFFCPVRNTTQVLSALHQAGAGKVGKYSHCSFRHTGTGSFLPEKEAKPTLGQRGELSQVEEERIEVLLPAHCQHQVLNALKEAHPYEEVAYFLSPIHNPHQQVGAGQIGQLPKALPVIKFLELLKKNLSAHCVKYTKTQRKRISKVAVCGGTGSFLIREAQKQEADAYVTADVKYHEFFDAEQQLLLCDIGHYESESHVKSWICAHLTKKLRNIACLKSNIDTNPIKYF